MKASSRGVGEENDVIASSSEFIKGNVCCFHDTINCSDLGHRVRPWLHVK